VDNAPDLTCRSFARTPQVQVRAISLAAGLGGPTATEMGTLRSRASRSGYEGGRSLTAGPRGELASRLVSDTLPLDRFGHRIEPVRQRFELSGANASPGLNRFVAQASCELDRVVR
jgi:hypothetical protein